MKALKFLSVLLLYALLFPACESTKETRESTSEEEETMVQEVPDQRIQLVPLPSSPDFPDAILNMNSPLDGENHEPGKISFSYTVTNFRLGDQTSGNTMKLANSTQGQHIHVILNNGPYDARYNPEFEKDLGEGHYVVLSFLSRSYHESVKSPDGYVLRQFTVGNPSGQKEVDLTEPHMFYSRPKGEYQGENAKNVLLDFYLVNTELSADGNKVRATINGQSFIITEWAPQVIQGMPMGENTIKLELLDNEGQVIPGPYNQVERVITLTQPGTTD